MAPTLNLAHTKVSKKERAEFATIEEKVEELELLAVEAQKALDDANAMARRLSQSAILELAGQVSATRKAADISKWGKAVFAQVCAWLASIVVRAH